jgi:hypothetical protein
MPAGIGLGAGGPVAGGCPSCSCCSGAGGDLAGEGAGAAAGGAVPLSANGGRCCPGGSPSVGDMALFIWLYFYVEIRRVKWVYGESLKKMKKRGFRNYFILGLK